MSNLSSLLYSSLLYSSNSLTSALNGLQSQHDYFAVKACSAGVRYLQNNKYQQAVTAFKAAIGYDRTYTDAYQYLAVAYNKLGKTGEAIKTLQQAVQVQPTSTEALKNLGKAYIENKDYANAEKQFLKISKLSPASADAREYLGSIYLATNRLTDAAAQFSTMIKLAPGDEAGYYGLGQVYNKQQKYDEAVKQFQKAVKIKPKFEYAYADMAYAYIGLGKTDKALEQVKALNNLHTDLGRSLANEIQSTAIKPQMTKGNNSGSADKPAFQSKFGPNTPLYFLDYRLATPGAAQTFTMVFQFSRPMDPSSVQNTTNWTIGKAAGGTAGVYNNGTRQEPERQITIPPLPKSVTYDPKTCRATVSFSISQNAAGNGLIDPSHWVFKFGGVDVDGKAMDTHADEYDGFAGKTF